METLGDILKRLGYLKKCARCGRQDMSARVWIADEGVICERCGRHRARWSLDGTAYVDNSSVFTRRMKGPYYG